VTETYWELRIFLCDFQSGGCYTLNMMPDNELLRRYAQTKSEEAFAEVVRRHVNLVYSAALRRLNGDRHLAQDAAQVVFTALARKASALSRRATLTGWLYTSALFAAAEIARTESRRRNREEKFMRERVAAAAEPDWEKLRPVLDAVMHGLKEADREAILLRYFENRPLAQVGEKLGLGENAARMRVERALEKMRALLAKRGIAITEGLAAAISANAVELAPAGMAAALATNSVAAAGTGTFALLKIMTATKLTFGLGALALAGVTTALVIQHQTNSRLETETVSLRQQIARLNSEAESLSNRPAVSGASGALSESQLRELMRLRGEVGILRGENRRLKAAPLAAATTSQTAGQEGDSAEAQQTRLAHNKMNDAKQLLLAELMYAQSNQGQLATNIDQIATGITNLSESNSFELVYRGSTEGLTNAGSLIWIRESQSWPTLDGKWAKTYGFADGHSELRVDPDNNFDPYEQQHMIPPPSSQ
jgi:RNA polymerase sigma factor (sigma-70 family)